MPYGMSEAKSTRFGTSVVNRCVTVSIVLRPLNGTRPASISNTTHAKLYTSARASRSRSPLACSGLTYAGVPADESIPTPTRCPHSKTSA